MNTMQTGDHLACVIEDHFSSRTGMQPWEKGRQELLSTLDAIIGSRQSDFFENPVDVEYPERSEYYRRLQKGLRHHWDSNRGLKIEELMEKIPKDTVFETSSPLYQVTSLEEVVLVVAVMQRKSVEGKMEISEKKAFQLFHDCYRPVCVNIVRSKPKWNYLTKDEESLYGWWSALYDLLIGIATDKITGELRNASLDTFAGLCNLRGWLKKVVSTFTPKYVAYLKQIREHERPTPTITNDAGDEVEMQFSDEGMLTSLDIAANNESINKIKKIVSQLPEKERLLIQYRFYDGLTFEQIGAKQNPPQKRDRMHHRLAHICQKIEELFEASK